MSEKYWETAEKVLIKGPCVSRHSQPLCEHHGEQTACWRCALLFFFRTCDLWLLVFVPLGGETALHGMTRSCQVLPGDSLSGSAVDRCGTAAECSHVFLVWCALISRQEQPGLEMINANSYRLSWPLPSSWSYAYISRFEPYLKKRPLMAALTQQHTSHRKWWRASVSIKEETKAQSILGMWFFFLQFP